MHDACSGNLDFNIISIIQEEIWVPPWIIMGISYTEFLKHFLDITWFMQKKKKRFGWRKSCGTGISAPSHVMLDGRTWWKIPFAAASSSSTQLCTSEKPPPITCFYHWKVPTEQWVWQEVQILSQMAKYSVFVEGFSWLLWSFFSFQIMSSGIRKHPEVKKRARHQRVSLPTRGVNEPAAEWISAS